DVEKIEIAGRHLLELINNILDLSKIDAGKMELNLAYHSIFSIIDDVFNSLVPQIESKNLSFKVEVINQAFMDELIYVDKLKVQQILMNLLSNAVKFTDHGRIDLIVEELGATDDLAVVFKVKDTGVGIAAEFLPHLFQRFNQEDGSRTRKHDGSGLGLAISKQFVEMMGGEIYVESERGKGSEFKIVVPTATVPAYSQELYTAEVKAKSEA
ncbi:MAG: ATP-binding protein, partial [Chloroflexota bacterium]